MIVSESSQAQSSPAIPLSATAQASGAAITHEQGIEFVTVGGAGNAPWGGRGSPGDRGVGRGEVDYDYRIGRFEVTTSQWAEFFNAAFDRPTTDRLPHLIPPTYWGAVPVAPTVSGGRRWGVPAGNEMRPVGNISWRMAAMYCNWLCNDKRTDRAAFLNGAYDVSTFTYTIADAFNDQLTHNANARYWIPTWDEMIKASHFDPNRNGAGQGGYWLYNTASDIEPVGGPPGQFVAGRPTQANGGWDTGDFPGSPFTIALGAYPTVQSPWGLLDAAGGTLEWTEEAISIPSIGPTDRVAEGSYWTTTRAGLGLDAIFGRSTEFPSISSYEFGFRIAAAVPSPTSGALLVLGVVLGSRTRIREQRHSLCPRLHAAATLPP